MKGRNWMYNVSRLFLRDYGTVRDNDFVRQIINKAEKTFLTKIKTNQI